MRHLVALKAGDDWVPTEALLDTGSETNVIPQRLALQYNLPAIPQAKLPDL